jgi:cytidine deaminase
MHLVDTSIAMRDLSYAPYRFVTRHTSHVTRHTSPISKFHVGAAVLCDDGEIVTGCNVEQVMRCARCWRYELMPCGNEQASYGLCICAERVALSKCLSEYLRCSTRDI